MVSCGHIRASVRWRRPRSVSAFRIIVVDDIDSIPPRNMLLIFEKPSSIESLISDLAFILILGAIVTVLFKWIKQPVVLGYIVAGFLASPNFTYLPTDMLLIFEKPSSWPILKPAIIIPTTMISAVTIADPPVLSSFLKLNSSRDAVQRG